MNPIKHWISEHREAFYCVLSIALLLCAWHVLRAHVDPRIGFDGWSDVLYVLSNAAAGWVVVLCAYLSKKATHGVTSNADDRRLRDGITDGLTGARWLYVLELCSSAFWVLLWAWLILGRG